MGRYLMFFQYIGTRYCGVVRASHPPNSRSRVKMVGVQDVLESALEKLRPVDPIKLHVSSRTDTGVHALCNTAHFDLQLQSRRTKELREISTEDITMHVNNQLKGEDIRVIQTRRVSDNFHSQHLAKGRTYLYRIAAPCLWTTLPILEHNRCWPIKHSLDIESMRAASLIFLGTHDFSSFRNSSVDNHLKSPIKTLERIEISQGNGFLDHHIKGNGPRIEFWDVTFHGKSFLYRQVRRMTGALVAVGLGRIAPSDISSILESCDNSHMHNTVMAPPHGLYLKEVHYNENDLVGSAESVNASLASGDTSVT